MPYDYTISDQKWLTDQELCTIYRKRLECDNDPYWRERFDLATIAVLAVGMRVSEILEIYLHPTEGKSYCTLVEGPDGLQGRFYLVGTKGKGGGRKGRIAPKRHRLSQVIPEAVPWFKRRYEQRLRDGHNLLFSRQDGLPYRKLNLQEWWYQVMRLCGINRGWVKTDSGMKRHAIPSIHCGRHSFATWEIASRRLAYEEVAAQLGNSPNMVRTTYAHAVMETIFLTDKTPAWRAEAMAMGQGRHLRVAG